MKFSVNDLMNVSCFCDVYRKSLSEIKEQDSAETLAETVVVEAKDTDKTMER